MKDYREVLLSNISNILVECGIDYSVLERSRSKIIEEISKYDVNPACKELMVIETTSQKLIKAYAGTLLTEGKSKNTVKFYLYVLNRFIKESNKPLNEAGTFDIRMWLAKAQTNGASLRTCENYRACLSAFYQWLAREEFIDKNPMLKVMPIKFNSGRKQAFTDVEIDSLRTACTTLRQRAELELLLSSGARVSELCNLNISDVDMHTMQVNIRAGKGNKFRTTYMNEVCRAHLQKYLDSRTDGMDYLFLSKNNSRMTKESVENELKVIGRSSNVDNVHPHRCRRTFATNLARKGMDVRTIQQLMGHTDINTTMSYIAISEDRARNEYIRFS